MGGNPQPIDFVRLSEMMTLIPLLRPLETDRNKIGMFTLSLLDQAREGKLWTDKQIEAVKKVLAYEDWRHDMEGEGPDW